MSPLQVGKTLDLFHSTSDGRVKTTALTFDNKGIIEDKYYDKDPNRSVLITSKISYEIAKNNNIDIPYGSLGENILIDYNLYHLNPGTGIIIGEVELKVSQNCTLCKGFAKINEQLPELLKNDRGIFAKVVRGGVIHTGDNIYLLENSTYTK